MILRPTRDGPTLDLVSGSRNSIQFQHAKTAAAAAAISHSALANNMCGKISKRV